MKNNEILNKFIPKKFFIEIRKPNENDEDVQKLIKSYLDKIFTDFLLTDEEKIRLLIQEIDQIEFKTSVASNGKKIYGKWILDGLPCDDILLKGLFNENHFPDYVLILEDSVEDKIKEIYLQNKYLKFEDFKFVEKLIINEYPQWFEENGKLDQIVEDKKQFIDSIVNRILPIRDVNDKLIQLEKFKENKIKIIKFLQENNIFYSVEDISTKNWTDFVLQTVENYLRHFLRKSKHISKDDKNLLMGNTMNYCPVILMKYGFLLRGKIKFSQKYDNKMYFLASESALAAFVENPLKYSFSRHSPHIPPLRIFIIGSNNQTEIHLNENGFKIKNFFDKLENKIELLQEYIKKDCIINGYPQNLEQFKEIIQNFIFPEIIINLDSKNDEIRALAEELSIPFYDIPNIPEILEAFLQKLTHMSRINIFQKIYEIDLKESGELLEQGQFFYSHFKKVCPVSKYSGKLTDETKPYIFRNCIYFLHGGNNLKDFQQNPLKFIQNSKEFIYSSKPLKIIVSGPPFSGKTNLIERISSEFNLKIINFESEFPTNGWIFEGLSAENLNPDIIFKITTETIEIFKTLQFVDDKPKKSDPLTELFKLTKLHENWENNYKINEFTEIKYKNSKWSMFQDAKSKILNFIKNTKLYELNMTHGKPANISHVNISQVEFESRLSNCGLFCSVCWKNSKKMVRYEYRSNDLIRTENSFKENLIQYMNHFYWTCDSHQCNFITNPKKYISEDFDLIEKAFLLRNFPSILIQNNGFCIVAFVEDSSIIKGSEDLAVSYKKMVHIITL